MGKLRYDWEAIQKYYEEGHSVRACQLKFGFARQAWTDAVNAGRVVPRGAAMPIGQLLAPGSRRARTHVKGRLLKAGLLDNKCYECGIKNWRGRPLTLQLDHINGDGHDWALSNLRLLCPNCHSQTETWGSKNWKNRRITRQ